MLGESLEEVEGVGVEGVGEVGDVFEGAGDEVVLEGMFEFDDNDVDVDNDDEEDDTGGDAGPVDGEVRTGG